MREMRHTANFPIFIILPGNLNLIVNSFPLNNTGEQLDQRVMENNNSEPNTNNIDNI